MAFSGTAQVIIVGDNLVRIIAASEDELVLSAGATGTIGLFESAGTPDIRLPEGFKPRTYVNAEHGPVSLQDSVQVALTYRDTATAYQPVETNKNGSDPTDFEISMHNTATLESGDTGDLEIYVRFH